MPQVRWPVAGQVMGWIEMLDEERMLTGLLCSILLHGAFVVLFILLRSTSPAPRPIPAPAIVQADLVPLAETGVSPPTSQKGLVPQQRAAEKAKQDGTGIPRPNDKIAEAARDHADQAAPRTPQGR